MLFRSSSLVSHPRKGRPNLDLVDAEAVDRLKGPQLIPFKAPGMALLICKIISAVSSWKNCHPEVALRSYGGGKVTQGERALQKSISYRQAMGDSAGVRPGLIVRSNGLRVEEVEVCISGVLRSRMERCG